MVAPGRPLRDGLDRILRAKRGGLVVVGDGPGVLSICSGGFLLDAEFSPQRLSELAKMDGAIILAADASRIARANVHLMPKATIPTSETGTRHRTAERVARSIDVPVLSVSAAMSVIAVYRNDHKHTIQPTGWLHDRTDQALATMQRFRNRFDVALNGLSILEVEDTVSVGDVVGVVQAAEMVLRIAEEVDGYLVELGEDGRLVGLQSAELVDGVAPALQLVVRDYCGHLSAKPDVRSADAKSDRRPAAGKSDRHTVDGRPDRRSAVATALEQLTALSSEELADASRVAGILGLPGAFNDAESALEPRGYRLLYRLPRFSDAIIERIVDRFVNLQQIMRASLSELEQVEGVGQARAHSVKDGLTRLAEASIFERYQ
jgi:diadenylate cyclase